MQQKEKIERKERKLNQWTTEGTGNEACAVADVIQGWCRAGWSPQNTLLQQPEAAMYQASYEDALLVARILGMEPDAVWSIIRGMSYSYLADLKIAVLNSPLAPRRQDPSESME